ncbi:MAG TPA: alpha-amylase family glycosyl hydrolase [Chloroflexia bacterium]|nr:alpha-amylase family glycosyl hydrolase [Chloroflexia bacterium]
MKLAMKPTFALRTLFALLLLLNLGFVLFQSSVAQAAGPWLGNYSRNPGGYIAASDNVAIKFEVYPQGSSGAVRYTTNNWSTSSDVTAVKVGTDGNNDVLQASIPAQAANTWVQYALYASNSGGTTWFTDSDSNDANNNEMYVVDSQHNQRVYQLFVRTYGASAFGSSTTGTFNAISSTDITNIKNMGFDTIWLTGIFQQETSSTYGAKGTAGSPYAIRDHYSVSSDLGTLTDFNNLVSRIHGAQMKVMVDFIGNHTAREYTSTNPNAFSTSNYIWVDGSGNLNNAGNGTKAYGNDSHVFPCGTNDWTDTAILDYHGSNADPTNTSSTYYKWNQVVSYWQGLGVDAFRADFAHGIPGDFWAYIIAQSKQRNPNFFWMAEAYDNDCYVNGGNWRTGSHINTLFSSGFDGVYDKGNYDQARNIYTSGWWANGLTSHRNNNLSSYGRGADYMVEFTSNHDEVQPASNEFFGGANNCYNNGTVDCNNMLYGKVPTSMIYLEDGTILMYNGHEVGEPANGIDDSIGGNDGKTSIFNYVNMPQMSAYRSGTLDARSSALQRYYSRLVNLSQQPAFKSAEDFYGDISANNSGLGNDFNQWLYAYTRVSGTSRYVVIANFDRSNAKTYTVHLTSDMLNQLGIANNSTSYTFTDRLNTEDDNGNAVTPYSVTVSGSTLWSNGLTFTIPANTTLVLQR